MPVPESAEFFVDPGRCIGCNACVQACTECDTHKGHSMIQLDYVDRGRSPQTVPVVCMHCDSPTCAEVCPADAIKRTGDGVVQTALKPRCIGCNNCVLACPFGVPKMNTGMNLMMKCDMCYDRTSVGQEAHVRLGLPQPGPALRHPRGGRAAAAGLAGPERLPLREPDHHHQGQHAGAEARGGRSTSTCCPPSTSRRWGTTRERTSCSPAWSRD